MKYITYTAHNYGYPAQQAIVFEDNISHREVWRSIIRSDAVDKDHPAPIGAGFVYCNAGVLGVRGESESLDVKPSTHDIGILIEHLAWVGGADWVKKNNRDAIVMSSGWEIKK